MSLTKVSYSMINGAVFNALDYGAIADGNVSAKTGTDNGPFIRAALLTAAMQGGGTVYLPFGTYKILTTVIVPNNVVLDLGGSFIVGPGVGSSTDLFQSGYLSDGVIVTNIGTTAESETVVITIKNAVIYYCGNALNIYDTINGSEFSNLSMNDCTCGIYANRCFYSIFQNCSLRTTSLTSAVSTAGFYFVGVDNVQQIESCFVNGRVLGWQISGGANGFKMLYCSAESCGTGVLVAPNETGPIQFDTCYFEDNTTVAVNLDCTYDLDHVSFINCFFNGNAIAIQGAVNHSPNTYINIDSTNRFYNNTQDINFANNSFYTQNKVSFINTAISGGTYPTIPSTFSLGTANILDIDQLYYNAGTGAPAMRTKVFGNQLIPFFMEGNGGAPKSFDVPFCVTSSSGSGSSVVAIIDTKIVYNDYSTMVAYRLDIADNSTTVNLYGFIFGTHVAQQDSVGKTFTASNNGGYLRLSISNFNTAANITGVVRFI